MKVHSAGGWIIGLIGLAIVGWQLALAVLFGRMDDFLFDEDDLFFFENPVLFLIQFAILVAAGAMILYYGKKALRKGRAK